MSKIKTLHIEILFIILLSLIFILWGRIFYSELNKPKLIENIITQKDRIEVLSSFGWEVAKESEIYAPLQIPKNFDAIYNEYNKIQKMSGFDLFPYRGKTLEKYTYLALNFPKSEDKTIYINILISDGKLVGGDCVNPSLSGFILPLDRRFLP